MTLWAFRASTLSLFAALSRARSGGLFWLMFFSVFTSVNAHAAKEVRFKEYPFEITRGERLVVQGLRGAVKLSVVAPGKTPVVRARKVVVDASRPGANERFENLSFTVRREAGIVFIEPKGPSTRQEWIDWTRPGQPELSYEIEAPSTPAEIHIHSGNVSVTNWKDAVAVTLQDGRVTAADGAGAARVSILRGSVTIERQKGPVEVESHAAKVNIASVDGDVQVHAFAGESQVSGVKGELSVRTKAGTMTLSKISGGLVFDNGRGKLEGSAIEGTVRGTNDDGSVSLQLAGEADVSIETQDGSVSVKPPGGAGVLLKLSSEEGPILAPSSVTIPRTAGPKSVVARLDGAPKGVIVLKAKRGTIRIR